MKNKRLRLWLWPMLLWLLQIAPTFAQQSSLTGIVKDTIDFKTVAFGTVSLIRLEDSVLVGFTRIQNQGDFKFTGLRQGNYRVQITRPGFVDYEEIIKLDSNEVRDLKLINLYTKTHLLKEVIIRDKIEAIRIKGDTTEFLVDSFLTNKNASVEDLMKKLPGIQVDKDGKITAQGQQVKKVLVDGEEFFGDDPTIATKNIKATQVESIQVYDKKSDQATISGIDDGEKEKTINLKLKEDAKKGYFGKLKGGVGTDSRHESDAMFNRFNKKQKVSAYAALSNTNKTDLDWEDNQKYGGSANTDFFMDDDGSFVTYYNSDGFWGIGIPRTWYMGGHYSDKVKQDKHAYGINLSYKEMSRSGFNNDYTKYILPDTFYFNNDNEQQRSFKKATNVSGKYEWTIDSLNTLKLTFNAKQGYSSGNVLNRTENRNALGSLVNSNNMLSTTAGENMNGAFTINHTKKFVKPGRTLSTGIVFDYMSDELTKFINSDLRIFQTDTQFTTLNTDQKKRNTQTQTKYSFSTTFTEPLSKKYFIITDYAFNGSDESSTRLTLTKSAGSDYINLVDSLSSDFSYKISAHRGGISLKYQFKKITASLGGRMSFTELKQLNLVNQLPTNRSFINYFPAAKFVYKIGTSSNFELNYSGRTRQPSLSQLQPLVDNNNPLRVMIGNTALVQSFINTYNLSFSQYKPLTGSGYWANLSFRQSNNDFTSKDQVSADGRITYQTVNVNGNYQLNGYVYQYFSFKKSEISMSNNVRFSYAHDNNFINGLANLNTNKTLSFGTYISKEKEQKYEVYIHPSYDYNYTTSSIRKDVVTAFWLQSYEFNFTYVFPKKLEFEADITWNIRQKTADFTGNVNTTIVNLSLKKKFTKSESWHAELGVRDLLNQNLGFYRYAQSNFVNENTHTVLRRYFMLSITYNFTSAKTKETTPNP